MEGKKILVCGTGALGTLFAAKLAALSYDVIVFGSWQTAIDALNLHGAKIDGGTSHPVQAVSKLMASLPIQIALVLVKSWQTERVSSQLRNCLDDNGVVLSLQNGLGNEDILGKALGIQKVVIGVTTVGATLLAPGVVRQAGEGTIWIEKHAQIKQMAKMLRASGFKIVMVRDILPYVWSKLIVNAAINPITAIIHTKNEAVSNDPLLHALMSRLVKESTAVAEAHGIALPFRNMVKITEEVANMTGANMSSMFSDICRGAPTEVDAINGEIVRIGETHGVDVSVNRLVWKLVTQRKTLSSAELSELVSLDHRKLWS